MAKVGDSRFGLAGSSPASRPNCTQDHLDAPLMYAIGFALGTAPRLDSYLHSVFPPYPAALGGGDPGWLWYHEKKQDGSDVIVVEIFEPVAPPSGIWNEYSPEKLRYEVRAALSNLVMNQPACLGEVDEIIRFFDLIDVATPDGLMPIPRWDGIVPSCRIIN